MNTKEFIKYVKSECKKHNIKCVLKNTKTVRLTDNNDRCSGYFDEESLVVAMNRPDALQILVHEYGHLTQWVEQCEPWVYSVKNNSHDKLYRWLAGENIRDIKKAISICRDLELDNEKRSVKIIKEFNLPIDTNMYIKTANAYVQFYNYILISRKWCTPNNTPYKNKYLLEVMPSKFNMNYNKLTNKLLKIFKEEKI
jgi:hypothetical protein